MLHAKVLILVFSKDKDANLIEGVIPDVIANTTMLFSFHASTHTIFSHDVST